MPHPFLPDILVDVITQDIIEDPVTAEDGHVYSHESISEWIETCQEGNIPIISPTTRQEMGPKIVKNVKIQQLLNKLNNRNKGGDWEVSNKTDSAHTASETEATDTSSNKEGIIASAVSVDMDNIALQAIQQDYLDQSTSTLPLSLKNMSDLLRMLDITPTFSTEILANWTPPCITVVGNESSGKSTILERLLMMSIFPRGEDICTRVPTKVELRYSKVSQTPTLDVVNTLTGQQLISALPLPSLDSAHLDVMATMTDIIQEQCGNAVGVCVDRMIIVHVFSPMVPSLDIVDLPGIVATASRASVAADVPAKTRQVVEEYISSHPESWYLALIEAGSRFSCATCLEFVQNHNLQSKTVGVVTKCDLISTKALKELRRCVISQDVSVGGIVLEPFGYVCTMHDAGEEEEEEEEDNNDEKEDKKPPPSTKKKVSNLSRLLHQDRKEEEWFKSGPVQCEDMLASGHAGSRSIVSKLHSMYLQKARLDLIPKVLLYLHTQREIFQNRSVALGMPLPPALPQPTTATDGLTMPPPLTQEYQQFRTDLGCHIHTIIHENASQVNKAYADSVLKPLVASVRATSTGSITIGECLNPLNSVEKWLKNLQSILRAICTKSVEKVKIFWCEFIENLLLQDESSFRMARFSGVITHIKTSMRKKLDILLVHLLDSMEQTIGQFLETVNLPQGVAVTYDFTELKEKVTICWESDTLGHSLVYHLTCSNVLLSSTTLSEMVQAAVQTVTQHDVLQENCADKRTVFDEEISVLENQYRQILATLVAHRQEMDESCSPSAPSSDQSEHFSGQLKNAGFCPKVLLKNHFSLEALRHGSFTVADLLAAGQPSTSLFKAGYSVTELRQCNINLSVLIGQAVAENKTLTELVKAGFTYRDLDDFGYDFVLMMGVGCKNISKGQVFKALLLLDFDEEEHIQLLHRGLIAALLSCWLLCHPVVSEGEMEKKLDLEELKEQTLLKDDLMRVFCKFYRGQESESESESESVEDEDGLSEHHLIPLVSLAICPSSAEDTPYSSCLAMQTLRRLTTDSKVNLELLLRTNNVAELCFLEIVNMKEDVSSTMHVETLMVVRNTCVYFYEHVLERGYVPLLLKYISSLKTATDSKKSTLDEEDLSSKAMAGFVLCLLSSRDVGIQAILHQNKEGIITLATQLSPVITLTKSVSKSVMYLIVQGIRNISKHLDTDTRGLWMSDSVVLTFLLDQLHNNSDMELLEPILSIMHDLCVTSSQYRQVFALKGLVIKPLTHLLGVSLHLINEHAIKLLLLFVDDSSTYKLSIAKEGGIALLLKMLQKNSLSTSKLLATSLLIPLAAETTNSLAIVKEGAVDLLLDMLYADDDTIKEAAAATMRSLAYLDENRVIIANDGGIDPLLTILQAPNVTPSCKIMATRTLRNLAFNCVDNKMAIANLGGIQHLVAMLDHTTVTTDMGVIVAAGVLQNLCYKIPENITLLIEANALPLLADVLLHGTSAAREACAGVVRNVANDGTHCLVVYRSGVLEALIWMLKHEMGACQTAAKDALRTVAQNEFCRTNIKQAGIGRKDINYKKANW